MTWNCASQWWSTQLSFCLLILSLLSVSFNWMHSNNTNTITTNNRYKNKLWNRCNFLLDHLTLAVGLKFTASSWAELSVDAQEAKCVALAQSVKAIWLSLTLSPPLKQPLVCSAGEIFILIKILSKEIIVPFNTVVSHWRQSKPTCLALTAKNTLSQRWSHSKIPRL